MVQLPNVATWIEARLTFATAVIVDGRRTDRLSSHMIRALPLGIEGMLCLASTILASFSKLVRMHTVTRD
jgi:hypothetical protein